MNQIFEAYGNFLLDGIVVVLLFLLVFLKITDENGNQGILNMIGARLPEASTKENIHEDFTVYKTEGQKTKPIITFEGEGGLSAGSNYVSDFIKAVDYAGQELPVKVLEIITPGGICLKEEEMLSQPNIMLSGPGVYTVRVSATDDGNRKTICMIRLPVNG